MNQPWLRPALFAGLAIYSVALLGGEIATSEGTIRVFFSDVRQHEMWFGLNTTLSVALLWGTALLFAVSARCLHRGSRDPKRVRFYASQMAIFLYLGADDRFMVHETLGGLVPFDDVWILLSLGFLELALLVGWMPREDFQGGARRLLVGAAACFALSTLVDALDPQLFPGRLSVEDLSKTWGGALLFMWAWDLLGQEIDRMIRHPMAAR